MSELVAAEYESMADAPRLHVRIMELTATGIDPAQIATFTDLSYDEVIAIQNLPTVQNHIRALQQHGALVVAKTKEKIDELLSLATSAIEGILTDEDCPRSLKLKAATEILDRHSSGEFAKKTKTESTEIRVIDTARIAEIRQKGLELGNAGPIYDCIREDNGRGGEVFKPQD